MSETAEADIGTDEGWLSVGAVVRLRRKSNGRWWPLTGVIDGYTVDERYLLRDQATGERWLPKIDGGVLEILEVIHPGHPEASRTLTYAEAMAWKREHAEKSRQAHDQAVYEVLAAADVWVGTVEASGADIRAEAGVLADGAQRLVDAVLAWRAVHPS